MSFNINKTQQSDTLFNRSGIDTSNWPARHDFLSKLPSDIENYTFCSTRRSKRSFY